MSQREKSKKEKIGIDKALLIKWWKVLNNWKLPEELSWRNKKVDREFILGAFSVVDYFITWKFPPGEFKDRNHKK